MNNIDIVIVNYKSTSLLIKCLESVYQTLGEIKAKIFVEDNGSPDVGRIRALFPEVVLTENSRNVGFARAVNGGVRKGRAPYILLLNPDSLVLDGFFKTVHGFMEQNHAVGILGPKILNADFSVQGSARAFPTPLTAFFGRNSLLSKWFPQNKITRKNILTISSDGKNPMSVDWVSGACMVIRRDAIEITGLLDERFFMYWEDADLCRRMRAQGWGVTYLPAASVIHYGGMSSDQMATRSLFEFHKSGYRLFAKYSRRWGGVIKPAVVLGLALRLLTVLTFSVFRKCLRDLLTRNSEEFFQTEEHRERKTKILTIISRLNIGGPAIHVSMITKELNKEKFDSFLVSGQASSEEGDMSYLFREWEKALIVVPSLRREIELKTDIRSLLDIYRLLREIRPDIVATHTAKAGFTGRIAVLCRIVFAMQRIFSVHTFHGNVFRGYFNSSRSLLYVWIERILARFTDVIIALSHSQKRELVEEFHIASPEKIKTVPLGLDLEQFLACGKYRGQFRHRFGIPKDAFLIGIVGRLAPIKNHLLFFRAAKSFLQENPNVPVRFVVVGDGELRHELERFVSREGLERAILFCGWMSNLPLVYADLDILALTSLNEGTPMSIIEAMASSVPVISTEVGGIPDLIGFPEVSILKGECAFCERGIFCRSGDALGLAKAFGQVLREEREERADRLYRATRFVKTHYAKERLLFDLEELFEELMERKVPKRRRGGESVRQRDHIGTNGRKVWMADVR